MAYYKLVSSGRSDVVVDEIILSRDDAGEVEKAVSVNSPVELSEQELSEAQAIAGKISYKIVEAPEPQDKPSSGQTPGADVVAESPVVQQTGPSNPEIDQVAGQTQTSAARQDQPPTRQTP